jgi:uncharacterized OB-fold protein
VAGAERQGADSRGGGEVLTDHHVLEYPYSRSVGPVIGTFLTALRQGRLLGVRASGGRVVFPPTEYDPDTAEATGELVEVGPGGRVESWAWVEHPRPEHPLDHPFAWVLVRPDGADTSLLHVLSVGSPDHVRTGMRVVPRFVAPGRRRGAVDDIEAFVPEGSAGA